MRAIPHFRPQTAFQTFGVDHFRTRASATRLLQVYDAQQGGRAEEAAELRADPRVNTTQSSVLGAPYFRLIQE